MSHNNSPAPMPDDAKTQETICECGGVMLEWQRGLVYPDCDDPNKITLRCVACGAERSPAPVPQPPTCHCGTAMTRTSGGWVCEREISRDGDRIQVCGASISAPLPPLAAMRVDDKTTQFLEANPGDASGWDVANLLEGRAEMVRELARIEAWPKRYGEDVDRINEMWAIASNALRAPLPDCPGCTDPRSEGTHFTPSKQHP